MPGKHHLDGADYVTPQGLFSLDLDADKSVENPKASPKPLPPTGLSVEHDTNRHFTDKGTLVDRD